MAGFYGAPAEQDLVFPLGDAAGDDLGIFIVDGVAGRAYMARQVVPIRYALFHRLTALAAILHGHRSG
jgi:hypothetical protein